MHDTEDESTLTWIHVGDLHIENAGDQNHRDFESIIDHINQGFRGQVDFCYLPGDNANEGTTAQYLLIRKVLDRLLLPVHVIPGDHDLVGDLSSFYWTLGSPRLPKAFSLKGYRCLFLDMVSAGSGGPDFRLGASDWNWLDEQLHAAQQQAERPILFMHAYPSDLAEGRRELTDLIARYRVMMVDMGHTHYNELTNDGHTIYATTRSTGQIEEGPVGFSVICLDRHCVSWRFKPLASDWPLVMITSPAASALITTNSRSASSQTSLRIAARAWSPDGIGSCRLRLDEGPWQAMQGSEDGSCWLSHIPIPQGPHLLTVEAVDRAGRADRETIQIGEVAGSPRRARDGSDADTVGPWPEKHIPGTQLGPNKNGHAW